MAQLENIIVFDRIPRRKLRGFCFIYIYVHFTRGGCPLLVAIRFLLFFVCVWLTQQNNRKQSSNNKGQLCMHVFVYIAAKRFNNYQKWFFFLCCRRWPHKHTDRTLDNNRMCFVAIFNSIQALFGLFIWWGWFEHFFGWVERNGSKKINVWPSTLGMPTTRLTKCPPR